MIFRTIEKSEIERWAAHCDGVFATTPEGYFLRHFQLDPFAEVKAIFIAEDETCGEIAATVRVFIREVYLYGHKVPMGGIGEVSTKEAYRRQGLSGKLLTMAKDYMRSENIPISTLFAGACRFPHYRRQGYEVAPLAFVHLRIHDAAPLAGTLRPATLADAPALSAIHAQFSKRLQGLVVRNEAYWQSWVFGQSQNIHVLQAGQQTVAYVLHGTDTRDGQSVLCCEFGALPGFEGNIAAMLQALCKQTSVQTLELSAGQLPFVAGCSHSLLRHYTRDNLMIQCIHPFLIDGHAIETTAQLQQAYLSCTVYPADDF